MKSTTAYLGNTRTVSNEYLLDYCSSFGLVVDCSRRLKPSEVLRQNHLVDFTFVRFLNIQSLDKFLATSIHTLGNGIVLDVRPFDEILHTAVPLHVDRKICIDNIPPNLSLADLRKYFRSLAPVKQATLETNGEEQRRVYIEFETSAGRNKILKGAVKRHRLREHTLDILPFLRPTDIDLHNMEEQKVSLDSSSRTLNNDQASIAQLEQDYSLRIRHEFDTIDFQINEMIEQKRQNYRRMREMLDACSQ